MRPDGLMDCMSRRKLPLGDKQNEMAVMFNDIRNLIEKLESVPSFKVSTEIKTAMVDSLKEELQEIKNEMYELIESIGLPKINFT